MDLAEDGNSFKQEFLLRFCWKNVSSRMLGLFDLVIPEEEAANNIHILKTAPRTVWLPTNETRTVKFIRIKDFFLIGRPNSESSETGLYKLPTTSCHFDSWHKLIFISE